MYGVYDCKQATVKLQHGPDVGIVTTCIIKLLNTRLSRMRGRGEGGSCESSVAASIQTSQRVGKVEASRQRRCAPPLNKAAAEKSEVS